MNKSLGGIAVLALLIAVAGPGSAGAESRNAAGIAQAQAGKVEITEVSARKRRGSRHHRNWNGNWRDDRDWYDDRRGNWWYDDDHPYGYYRYDDDDYDYYRSRPTIYISPYGLGVGW